MDTFSLKLVYGPGDVKLTRQQFREKYNRELRNSLSRIGKDWSHQLAQVFIEVVKNFYDHANRQGTIIVTVRGNEVDWTAYDSGPGDPQGRTIEVLGEQALRDREKYKNSKTDGPCGLGLSMTHGGLNGLRHRSGVRDSTWSLTTRGRFEYKGHIVLTG